VSIGAVAVLASAYSLYLGFEFDRNVTASLARPKTGFRPRVCVVMPCTAGQTSIVIDYNGDIRVCELRKPIGNLRKCEMDFQRFWDSIERKREVQQVEHDKCFCTHICFMYDSMRHSRRVMLWELPSRYLGHLFGNLLRPSQRGKPQQTAKIEQTVPTVIPQLPSTDNMPTREMQA